MNYQVVVAQDFAQPLQVKECFMLVVGEVVVIKAQLVD